MQATVPIGGAARSGGELTGGSMCGDDDDKPRSSAGAAAEYKGGKTMSKGGLGKRLRDLMGNA